MYRFEKDIKYSSSTDIITMETIKKISKEQKNLRSYLSKMSSKEMDVKEKIFILYKLISYIYLQYSLGETRVIPNKIFTTKLNDYYDKQNCDIEFKTDLEYIKTFRVNRGKPYYYDKDEVIDQLGME